MKYQFIIMCNIEILMYQYIIYYKMYYYFMFMYIYYYQYNFLCKMKYQFIIMCNIEILMYQYIIFNSNLYLINNMLYNDYLQLLYMYCLHYVYHY